MSDENTATFVCENCENRVEDAPMAISACVECSGEMVPEAQADRADPDAPASRPTPPDSLPQYVKEGVERQDADALRDLAEWAEQLAAWKGRDLAADDLEAEVGDDEELVDVQDDGSGGTIVERMIPCGKSNCSTCPHGPYKYRAYRDGNTVKTDYIGPA